MYCPNCFTSVPNDATFCHRCGSPLGIAPDENMGGSMLLPAGGEDDYFDDGADEEYFEPTDIPTMLDIYDVEEQQLAEFRFPNITPVILARKMEMQTYRYQTDGQYMLGQPKEPYRYWLRQDGDGTLLRVLLARRLMGVIMVRDYFFALNALKHRLPLELHAIVDPPDGDS